jgi:hypothetical protein
MTQGEHLEGGQPGTGLQVVGKTELSVVSELPPRLAQALGEQAVVTSDDGASEDPFLAQVKRVLLLPEAVTLAAPGGDTRWETKRLLYLSTGEAEPGKGQPWSVYGEVTDRTTKSGQALERT